MNDPIDTSPLTRAAFLKIVSLASLMFAFFITSSSFIVPEYHGENPMVGSKLLGCRDHCFLFDTAKWQWPDSLDAVRAAPNSHKILFENDKIRILEVTVDPYGFEPMHTHRYPGVMFGPDTDTLHYDIVYYRYDYDSVKHVYFAKDSVYQRSGGRGTHEHFMKPEGPHRVKNLSSVRIIAFRVEFKQT